MHRHSNTLQNAWLLLGLLLLFTVQATPPACLVNLPLLLFTAKISLSSVGNLFPVLSSYTHICSSPWLEFEHSTVSAHAFSGSISICSWGTAYSWLAKVGNFPNFFSFLHPTKLALHVHIALCLISTTHHHRIYPFLPLLLHPRKALDMVQLLLPCTSQRASCLRAIA